jgi:hypothetical protein
MSDVRALLVAAAKPPPPRPPVPTFREKFVAAVLALSVAWTKPLASPVILA